MTLDGVGVGVGVAVFVPLVVGFLVGVGVGFATGGLGPMIKEAVAGPNERNLSFPSTWKLSTHVPTPLRTTSLTVFGSI